MSLAEPAIATSNMKKMKVADLKLTGRGKNKGEKVAQFFEKIGKVSGSELLYISVK